MPEISIEQAEDEEGIRFILETDTLAKNVWLQTEQEGIFSDNYFDLVPGMKKEITFSTKPTTEKGFCRASTEMAEVKSMANFVKGL